MDERMTGGVLWFWLIACMMELIDELCWRGFGSFCTYSGVSTA
jgi:hypothetical protein